MKSRRIELEADYDHPFNNEKQYDEEYGVEDSESQKSETPAVNSNDPGDDTQWYKG